MEKIEVNKNKYRLGLDLGTNSLGWSLLTLNGKDRPQGILDLGVRIFSDGRNPKDKTSLAVNRRIARGARRRRDRYLRRRHSLMWNLVRLGLMTKDRQKRKNLENSTEKMKVPNPYELRVKALDEKLEPYELGRALYHLNQRRGFKSNRKTNTKEDKSKISEDIKGLEESIRESFSRSLGEFLNKKHQEGKSLRARSGEKLYPNRKMYEAEFQLIREKQSKYFSNITKQDWESLEKIIFHQRPLKAQEPGRCQFEPKEFRAPIALPSAQKFTIAQDIGNLQIILPDRSKQNLAPEDKAILWERLNRQKELAFSSIQTALKLPDGVEFNLETKRRSKLKGNATASLMSKKEYFGKKWLTLDHELQDQIVLYLLDAEEEQDVKNKALTEWGLGEESAENLSKLGPDDFPKGYARFCSSVLSKLWQKMMSEGLRYDEAAKKLGYNHSQSESVGLSSQLEYYGKLLPESVIGAKPEAEHHVKKYGRISNPTVHIGLNQLRLVVNAIIERYGPPQEIILELARDLKQNHEQRKATEKEQGTNQKENERIASRLKEEGIDVNGANILKYRLWEELNPKDVFDRKCPYSGETISPGILFTEKVEVEHILPFSKSLDDSRGNKTIAMTHSNREKGNRSPCEAFGKDKTRYEQILHRAKCLPKNKRWRFDPDAMDRFRDENQFLDRQLNDTRYLGKAAKKYLSHICPNNKIWVVPGRLTALLRRKWKFGKNRNDYRNHTLDSIIVGVTDRNLIRRTAAMNEEQRGRVLIADPWGGFYSEVLKALDNIVVSHRPDHSTAGAFHEETAYGKLKNPSIEERNQNYNVVYRKPLVSLSEKETKAIRDPLIRERLAKEIQENDGSLKDILEKFSERTKIKKVRLLKKENPLFDIEHPSINPIHTKSFARGEIHHIGFWKMPDGKIETKEVSFLEINRGGQNDFKPHPAAKRILKLHKRDLVKLVHKGKEKIARVVSLRPVNKQIRLVEHFESGNLEKRIKEGEKLDVLVSFSKLKEYQVRLIHVDPLGKIKDTGPVL